MPAWRGWLARHWRAITAITGAIVLVGAVLLGVVGWIGSERAVHPERKLEDTALADYPFAAITEDVRFASLDGAPLAAWFVPAEEPGRPVIILLHGYGRSRAELLPHAAYLHRAGYNLLLIDFRGRGESGGGMVTMGAREPLDVRAAVDYVASRPDVDASRIATQGVSLGASAGVLAMPDEPRIVAAVIEAPFSSLRGVADRSFEKFIDLPSFPFAPVTVFILEQRLDADADDIRPVDAIGRIGDRPVLIIEDLTDDMMPSHSGTDLYQAAPGPKELWQVPGAGHAAAYELAPAEYERRVLEFYQRALTPSSVAPAGR